MVRLKYAKETVMNRFVECLEDRRLRSVSLKAGVLTIKGTDGDDGWTVEQKGSKIIVTDTVKGGVRKYASSKVKTINMMGYAGNDSLTQKDNVKKPGKIDGGAGDDEITSGRGRNVIIGGDGVDAVFYWNRTEDLKITLDNVPNDGAASEKDNVRDDVEKVFGGYGDDYIAGSPWWDILNGMEGNDTLLGGAGDDDLYGQDGDDLLEGFDGADLIYGDSGDDSISGDAGEDTLNGGEGDDVFLALDGESDTLVDELGESLFELDEDLDLLNEPVES
jgi:Ca2+-binding RTX toxin-like protein